jgi:hypothetical protein
MRAILEQQFHHSGVAPIGRRNQRSVAFLVRSLDTGASGQQQSDSACLADRKSVV